MRGSGERGVRNFCSVGNIRRSRYVAATRRTHRGAPTAALRARIEPQHALPSTAKALRPVSASSDGATARRLASAQIIAKLGSAISNIALIYCAPHKIIALQDALN